MRRNPALDGLRACAVLAVIVFHVSADIAPGGFLGVTVFFVLSGYLITSLLLTESRRTGKINLKAFYVRRALRLYPALGVAVVLAALVGVIRGVSAADTAAASASTLLYLSDFTEAAGLPSALLGHTWSLAVEEQFYLVWPLVIIWLGRRDPRVVLWLAAGGAAIGAVGGAVLRHTVGRGAYFLPPSHVGSLLLGAALAAYAADNRSLRVPARTVIAVGASAALAVAVLLVRGPFATVLYPGGWLLAASAALLIVDASVDQPSWFRSVLSARPLVWLGLRSYGAYLYSAILTDLVNSHHGQRLMVRAALVFLGTLLLAGASYRWVELPFLRRKRRFQPLDSASGVVLGSN